MQERKSLCIVHVGLHHTATSSIQYFFTQNREKLKKFSIIYPNTGISGFQHSLFPGCYFPNHNALNKNRDLTLNNYLIKLKKELTFSDCEICILSSEVFTELLNADYESLKEIIKGLDEMFFQVKFFLTSRDPIDRALSQLKAMLRNTTKRDKFRKAIFFAHNSFDHKVKNTNLLINKWMKFNYEIIHSKMETKNALLNHLLILIPHFNIKNNVDQLELINFIKLQNDVKKNSDNFPPVTYLVLLLIGSEILNKDKNIENNLNFFSVSSHFEKLSNKQKLILNEISSGDIHNYLKLRNKFEEFDLDLILEKLKFKFSISFVLKSVIDDIIENLVFNSN